MKFGYIYVTTNKINGKMYIGKKSSSVFIDSYYGSGTVLKAAIKKHGKENFDVEVVEWCDDLHSLNKCEMKHIKTRGAIKSKMYYNIAPGGDGGDIVSHLSPDKRKNFLEKMSKVTSGENNPMYGRDRRSEGNTTKGMKIWKDRCHPVLGKKITEEQKKKMSDSKLGDKNPMYGKELSTIHKAKLRESKLGNKNPMYGKYGKNNHTSVRVRCITTGEEFDSIKEANKYYETTCIGEVCRGKRKTAGKHKITGERLTWERC